MSKNVQTVEEEKLMNYLITNMLLSTYNSNPKTAKENELNDKVLTIYKELFPSINSEDVINNNINNELVCLLGKGAF